MLYVSFNITASLIVLKGRPLEQWSFSLQCSREREFMMDVDISSLNRWLHVLNLPMSVNECLKTTILITLFWMWQFAAGTATSAAAVTASHYIASANEPHTGVFLIAEF